MVQPTQARNGSHDCSYGWLLPDRTPVRRVRLPRILNAVLMIIVHVIADKSAKMLFVQRDDRVKNLAAATSHPALRDAVLPGCLDARPFGFQTCRLQERGEASTEFRIPLQDHVSV